MTGLKK